MMIEYYIVEFKINSKSKYCIWYTSDKDGFVLENNKVKTFRDINELHLYCEKEKINIMEYVSIYDLDNILSIDLRYDSNVDCNEILDFWNIVQDISYSTQREFLGNLDDFLDIHSKLFYGCNIPAMNMKNKYNPSWNSEELIILSKIITQGIEILENEVKI